MPAPSIHEFPVKRPGFIVSCEWMGADDELALRITHPDETGVPRVIDFQTRNAGANVKGEVCLPTSLLGNDLHNLGARVDDILTAHTRMACLIARSGIPGSEEFHTALVQGLSSNLNTAMGVVKVVDVNAVDGDTVAITYKCGNGPEYVADMDYQTLNSYAFIPQTQLFVVPGAIKKQFATYVHDYPNHILTQQQRDDIAAYVLALQPWV